MKQANELMEGFDYYLGSSKTMARVSFGTLLWCADRPEAQSLTHTMKEGTHGKVAGWSVKPSEEFLPACVDCYRALIEKHTKWQLRNTTGLHMRILLQLEF